MGSGIERFTEGKRWTASRLRDDFLFYYEKYLHLSEHDQKIVSPPKDWDPFVKQTYSAWVNTENGNRKWHLTAYYTQRTEDCLRTIDDIPALRDIAVPSGYFLSNADIRSNRPLDGPHSSQRTSNSMGQVPGPLHHTPSPDSHHSAQTSPYPTTPSVFTPPSRFDHHVQNFSIPPRYPGGMNDQAGYVPGLRDGFGNLPSLNYNSGPQVVSRTRHTRPAPHHDSFPPGHGPIPRSSNEEPPISLVPMSNLIAPHPFPRNVQDEQALRAFVP